MQSTSEVKERCQCGQDAHIPHCPNCGRRNCYALKDKVTRPNPHSGDIEVAKLFRCRACGDHFDEFQWKYNCTAPPIERTQAKIKLEATSDDLKFRAVSGEKFTENDKRHFKRVVGISYAEFMVYAKQAEELKLKGQFKALNDMAKPKPPQIDTSAYKGFNKTSPLAPPTLDDKFKSTPFEIHMEGCARCMMAAEDNDDQLCPVGRALKANPDPLKDMK